LFVRGENGSSGGSSTFSYVFTDLARRLVNLNVVEDSVNVLTDDVEALDRGLVSFDMSELDAFVFEFSEESVLVSDISSVHMVFGTSNNEFTGSARIRSWREDVDEGFSAWGNSSGGNTFSEVNTDVVGAFTVLDIVIDDLDVGINDLLTFLSGILSLPVSQLLAFSVEVGLQLVGCFIRTEVVFSTSDDEVAGMARINVREDFTCFQYFNACLAGTNTDSDVSADLERTFSSSDLSVDGSDVGIDEGNTVSRDIGVMGMTESNAFSVEFFL